MAGYSRKWRLDMEKVRAEARARAVAAGTVVKPRFVWVICPDCRAGRHVLDSETNGRYSYCSHCYPTEVK